MSFNVKVGGVIFPTNEGILSNNVFDISPYNNENKFYCFELFVPDGKGSFMDWKREFELNVERTFIKMSSMLGELL